MKLYLLTLAGSNAVLSAGSTYMAQTGFMKLQTVSHYLYPLLYDTFSELEKFKPVWNFQAPGKRANAILKIEGEGEVGPRRLREDPMMEAPSLASLWARPKPTSFVTSNVN